jgi:low affinity Fe/Cu permease
MKNVMCHFNGRIAAHIVQLRGYLTPTKPGTIVVFDDTNSFTLNLASAEIAISCKSLAQVLNENVFSAHDAPIKDAPIKDVSIESKNNQLVINGKLHCTPAYSAEPIAKPACCKLPLPSPP